MRAHPLSIKMQETGLGKRVGKLGEAQVDSYQEFLGANKTLLDVALPRFVVSDAAFGLFAS